MTLFPSVARARGLYLLAGLVALLLVLFVLTAVPAGAVACQAGSYDNGSGCVPADPGYFVALDNATEQTPCPVGTFSAVAGSVACTLAPPGTFVDSAGATAATPCALGTYQPYSGSQACQAAEPGNYVDTPGAAEQTACQLGYYQPDSGSTFCLAAEPGNFVDTTGSAAQTACAAGTYQPDSGSTSCLAADPGNYVDTPGAAEQTACQPGTYSSSAGASSCTQADPGFYAAGPAATAQSACLAGTYSATAGAAACTQASLGYYVPTDQATEQTACPAGTYSDSLGAQACTQAQPGYYAAGPAAMEQIACQPGTYSSSAGASSCTPAQPGYYATGPAATEQISCPAGTFSSSAGAAACTPAAPGYYVPVAGATAQTMCPAGYTSESGAVACTEIPANQPPTADPGGPYLGPIGSAISFDGGASSDPNDDPLLYSWTFGDGELGASAAPSHTYGAAGVYTVCLTVDDGEFFSEEVCTLAAVYDPSAGFVTGGGWIWSAAGDCQLDAACAAAEGKASFGFVSKYKKGQSTPEGSTQFQFNAGGLSFHSSSYEWLVVAGANAKFKGEGLVNGQGPYSFMLTATDGDKLGGGADGFRIKIWDGGGVIYDNKSGANDESLDTTALGGGSIQIHTRK